MVGAATGSPGTFPTFWTSSNAGLTRTVVGTGTENGIEYTDVRFNGTATGTVLNVGFDGATVISATNGQSWTLSSYVKTTAGTLTSIRLRVIERNSVAGYLTEGSSSALTVTSSLNRLSYTRTNTNASCAFVEVSLYEPLTIGATYDFTIRIAAPQMELGAYATTFIPSSTAAVTRLADVIDNQTTSIANAFTDNTKGTIFFDLDDIKLPTGANAVFRFGKSSIPLQFAIYFDTLGVGVFSYNGGSFAINSGPTTKKFAVRFNGTQIVGFSNGVKRNTVNAVTSFDIDQMTANNTANGSFVINQFILFPSLLTDDECITLTTL
jgi:hypothetical protein